METIKSCDNLNLSIYYKEANNPQALLFISHGMAEHKERYLELIDYMVDNQISCVVYDMRGHGESCDKSDYGFLNDENGEKVIDDLDKIIDKYTENNKNLPVFLYGHSMGTLVVRNYLQTHDNKINGLIVSGAVFNNKMAKMAKNITSMIQKFKGSKYHSKFINNLAFGSYDKQYENTKNCWLSENKENVKKYNESEKCGFIFSVDGFKCLFSLIIKCFNKTLYQVKNPTMPILFLSGENDIVIGTPSQYEEQVQFLKNIGYLDVSDKLYPHMRHEILQEDNKELVYQDILDFIKTHSK